MVQTWETMQADLTRTIGASLMKEGERIERIYRDMSIGNAHRNTAMRDWMFRELALAHFGLPGQIATLQRLPNIRPS
jgi:3-hydroxy-9,10-secoandrosta-1,3,5(10)-triene-9,17-dione monooxygenase